MLIESVHLENVKSYERADASFAEGTNAICGPNGAGKSTLIEAIGFALFGSQRVRLEQLIRSGAAHGRIEVRFTSSLDELSYHVVRDLRRTGASTVTLASDVLGAVIATGVREVQEQLVQHLGLRPGVKLASLFEGVVGVPQGQLTYDFLLPPAPRKARFEELLALQEFELAHQRLLGPVQYGRTEVATLSAGLTAMAEQLQAMPAVEERLTGLQGQAEAVGEGLIALDRALQEVRAQRQRLDADQVAVMAAREQATRAQAARDLAVQRLGEALRRREEAAAAATAAEGAREAHDRFAGLEAQAQAIEEDLQRRDALRLEDHRLERDGGRLEEAVRQLTSRLEEAGRAVERLTTLQPLLARQADLEQARQEAREAVQAGRGAREQLARLQSSRGAYEREARVLRQAQPPLVAAADRRHDLAEERDEANAAIAALRADFARVRAAADAQRAALTAVKRGESRVCPSCRRPFEGGDVQGFVDHLAQQVHEGDAEAGAIEREGTQARKRLDDVQSRLAAAEEKAEQLRQNQAQLQAVQGLIAAADEQLREVEERLRPLDERERVLQGLEEELQRLGDPRTACAALRPQVDALPGIEREVAQYRERLAKLVVERRELAGRLSRFDGLDARLAQARRDRDACRGGYDTYRRFAPLAADLHAREQAVAEGQHAAGDAERAQAVATAEHRQMADAYDAAAHQEVRDRERRTEAEAAAQRSRLDGIAQQVSDGTEQLDRLRVVRAQAEAASARLSKSEDALSALRVVRDAVRLAGPEIARRLLSRVSSAANRTFSEMMGDFAIELLWRDDYGITLRRGADERDFAQLSGGEQMTAALAVRLALLREISDVGVAFFDEPTANLDEERRQSLADQIRNIHDFRQLFVISHDDSLEGVTDNVIHVSKENGVSRIEQG